MSEPDAVRPLRIVLTTQGTIGSLEPMLGLAQCLRDRGHSTVVAAAEPLASRSRELVETVTLEHSGPPPTWSPPDDPDPLIWNIRAQLPMVVEHFEQLRTLCDGKDLLIAFPFQLAAPMVRDAIGIPYVSLHYQPSSGLNSKEHVRATDALVNPVRAQLGLDATTDPLGVGGMSDRLVLYAISKHVCRRPKKWPDHHHMTGYFFSVDTSEPNHALREFIDAGPAPVVISLGSVVHRDPVRMSQLLIAAAKKLESRVVLQRGWSGLGSDEVPDDVHVADFVPHAWLFPRASVIVHAGGAGTTAAALRAGRPALVIPHWLDQPLWAALVRSHRCGSTLQLDALTPDTLAEAIRDLADNEKIAQKAARMAERLSREDGTLAAARLIEATFGSLP